MFTQSGSESISVDPSKGETRSESISLNATYIFNAEPLLLNVVRKVTPERILAPYAPGQDDKATGFKGLFHRLQTDWSGSGSYSEDDALKQPDKKTVGGAGKSNIVSAGNVYTKGDVDKAFRAADAVVEGTYGAAVICHHCLEPHGLVAEWGGVSLVYRRGMKDSPAYRLNH